MRSSPSLRKSLVWPSQTMRMGLQNTQLQIQKAQQLAGFPGPSMPLVPGGYPPLYFTPVAVPYVPPQTGLAYHQPMGIRPNWRRTGIGFLPSPAPGFLPPLPPMWAVLLPVVLTLIANQDKDSGLMYQIGKLCYTKWALEAFVIANAERYYGVWLITRCGSLMTTGYDLTHWHLCLIFLVIAGIISRVVAFIFMVTFQKK